MMATIWGGVINAILNLILIFGLNLDLIGAPIASVVARVTAVVVAVVSALLFLLRTPSTPFQREGQLIQLFACTALIQSRARRTLAGFAAKGLIAKASPAVREAITPPPMIRNAFDQMTI